jgi:hypothetical protein
MKTGEDHDLFLGDEINDAVRVMVQNQMPRLIIEERELKWVL